MEETGILGREEDRIFQLFVGGYDQPAYMRRARGVEEALANLLARCRGARDELLEPVRSRLATALGLAGDERRLLPLLADEGQLETLQRLRDEVLPEPAESVGRTRWGWRLRSALRQLDEALEAFNRRWAEYLPGVDLSEVNRTRDGYNKYYVLEKECALRSARLARQGFRPMEPMTPEELGRLLPPLPRLALRTA